VFDVARAHSFDDVDGELASSLDLTPESLFVEVVVLRESGDAVVLRLGAEQAARLPLAGQRPVETAERLDSDEIAEHEHVERDLELLLLLDLHGRMGVLARLVVLDDAARAERIDVDSVDLPRERHARSQLEPALQLGRRPLGAEQHFEAAREKRHVRSCLFADEGFEVAPQAVPKLARLQLRELEAHTLHDCFVEAPREERHRVLDAIRFDAVGAELLRQSGVEAVQNLVGDRAA